MGDDAQARERDRESVQALEGGGLPVTAEQRLREETGASACWTSDLSVGEMASVRAAGFEPAGLVMGASVYHLGVNWYGVTMGFPGGAMVRQYPCPHGYHQDMRTGWNWEHTPYESGLLQARTLAMQRLRGEAMELGAHGVVGIRHTMRPVEGGHNVEFNVVGTAVRCHGAPPLPAPFTSHLTGQDFGKLLRAGWVPVDLVMGVGAVEIMPGCNIERSTYTGWGGYEVDQLSEAAIMARDVSMGHMYQACRYGGGDGVVGVDVHFTRRETGAREGMVYVMLAMGTSVRRFDPAVATADDLPLPMVRLR